MSAGSQSSDISVGSTAVSVLSDTQTADDESTVKDENVGGEEGEDHGLSKGPRPARSLTSTELDDEEEEEEVDPDAIVNTYELEPVYAKRFELYLWKGQCIGRWVGGGVNTLRTLKSKKGVCVGVMTPPPSSYGGAAPGCDLCVRLSRF